MVKHTLSGLALAILMIAAPASASSYFCYAFNMPDNGDKEVMLSQIFSRSDPVGSRENELRWHSWLINNGWKVNTTTWSCLGPYESYDDAAFARSQAVSSYNASGWHIFHTNYAG